MTTFNFLVMKQFDIIALGELNVDLILNQIEGEPEIGKEKFAKQMTLTLGSSTAIFAANAAALGAKVAFCGMIGNDSFGDLVETSLKAKGVDTRYLIRQDKYATGATICMSYDEDRANLTYQGAMDFMSLDDINPEVFKEAKHIHISSIFMQSGVKRDLMKILENQGVTEVPVDKGFDPNMHEALMVMEGDEDGKVAQVYQKGYLMNGRVLRTAKVVVTKKKEQEAAPVQDEKTADNEN